MARAEMQCIRGDDIKPVVSIGLRAVGLSIVLLAAPARARADSLVTPPFEAPRTAIEQTPLDRLVLPKLREKRIEPANLCSDDVFVRRVFVDMTGTLPTAAEARAFAADTKPGKRAALVESLFARDEYADYWSLMWCDLLRVKSEFPINLWPNAVQAYHRWVREAVKQNMPCDRFARELLTASGSNFKSPPSNFCRAVQGRGAQQVGDAVALTFMGARADRWPAARRDGLAAFFSRVTYKPTREWKEEIVCHDPAATVPLAAVLPDGKAVTIPADKDPRQVFADWLTAPGNRQFASCAANRQWAWLMGRGIVHEPDDFRPDNPPSNPELLAYLAKELVASGYDLRHLQRLILNSQTYQQSSIPRDGSAEAAALFACYPARMLDAEVLADALVRITGVGEGYSSPIPEPFTFVPEYQRTISLADGSVGNSFLTLFGRPARDTGLFSERATSPTEGQRLYMLNSNELQRRIERPAARGGAPLGARGAFAPRPRADRTEAVCELYLTVLSRVPTDEELAAIRTHYAASNLPPKQALDDLTWALVNTKEFLHRH
jgi:hypothetical protein